MALPQQAIERLSRSSSKTQGAYRELLLLSFGLFFFALLLFLGLRFGYQSYLASSGRKLDQEIDRWSQSISAEDQIKTAALYSQLYNLRSMLNSRSAASPVFDLLERATLPDVYYTKFNLNASTREITLSGAARSLEKIAEQAARFEKEPEVERVSFTNAGKNGENPWQFTMSVVLLGGTLQETTSKPSLPAASTSTSTGATSTLPNVNSPRP